MFPGFLLNLSLFLSSALGQLGVGPLRPAKGMTLSPAGSGAVCQWQTSSTDRRGSGDQALNGPHWGPGPPGREMPGVQPPRIESPGTPPAGKGAGNQRLPGCFPSFLLCAARLEGQGRNFFEKKFHQKTLRSLRSAPGAHVRHSLAQARRSAAAPWRELRAQALGRLASLGLPLSLRHAIPPHGAYPSSPRAWPPAGRGWRRRWPSPWPCAPRPASG